MLVDVHYNIREQSRLDAACFVLAQMKRYQSLYCKSNEHVAYCFMWMDKKNTIAFNNTCTWFGNCIKVRTFHICVLCYLKLSSFMVLKAWEMNMALYKSFFFFFHFSLVAEEYSSKMTHALDWAWFFIFF